MVLREAVSWVAQPLDGRAVLPVRLVSALGCINELVELGAVKAGLSRLTLEDTNWDILANSLGALVAYAGYLLVGRRIDRPRR